MDSVSEDFIATSKRMAEGIIRHAEILEASLGYDWTINRLLSNQRVLIDSIVEDAKAILCEQKEGKWELRPEKK